jgi:hypothetical protein
MSKGDFMKYNQSYVGIAAIAFGVFVLIVSLADVLLRAVGVLLALALMQHGLALMRKPSLFVFCKELLKDLGLG